MSDVDTGNRRDAILDIAMDLASSEGLEGLTIGKLAGLAGMSKSGLFAHFGSKEDLQLATVHHAQKEFRERVWRRVAEVEPGIVRLRFMARCWLEYIEDCGLQGGCFFAAASAEFDGRPGGIRDRLVKLIGSWVGYLEQGVTEAIELGHLGAEVRPAQLTFEIHALVQESNLYRELFGRGDAFAMARDAIDVRLMAASTDAGQALLSREMKTTK